MKVVLYLTNPDNIRIIRRIPDTDILFLKVADTDPVTVFDSRIRYRYRQIRILIIRLTGLPTVSQAKASKYSEEKGC